MSSVFDAGLHLIIYAFIYFLYIFNNSSLSLSLSLSVSLCVHFAHALFLTLLDSKSSCEVKDSSGSSGGDVYKIYLHAIKFLSPETSTSGHHNNLGLPLDRMPQGQSDRWGCFFVVVFLRGGGGENFVHSWYLCLQIFVF